MFSTLLFAEHFQLIIQSLHCVLLIKPLCFKQYSLSDSDNTCNLVFI